MLPVILIVALTLTTMLIFSSKKSKKEQPAPVDEVPHVDVDLTLSPEPESTPVVESVEKPVEEPVIKAPKTKATAKKKPAKKAKA